MTAKFSQHQTAIIESEAIGEETRIGAFAHVLAGAVIGRNSDIGDHTVIENHVVVGDRVTIKSGVQLWAGVRIENDVFVGPNASFTNDPLLHGSNKLSTTVVKRAASIGANATILNGVVVGERAVVGAGSVVTQNVPADAVVAGNPAKITGYVGVPMNLKAIPARGSHAASDTTEVKGVTLYALPRVDDMRGSLTFAEGNAHIPFEIKRFFLVYDVPSSEIRGEHAHRQQHQFLICVAGSCCVLADDGENRREFWLASPSQGLHLAPMTWSVQYKQSRDAVLLVLTSDIYDPADYIREYDEFLTLLGKSV